MIFVGLGFRKAVTTKSFENLFRQVFNLTELPGPIKALATLDTKALNPALQEFAAAKFNDDIIKVSKRIDFITSHSLGAC